MGFRFIIPLITAFLTSVIGEMPYLLPETFRATYARRLLGFGTIIIVTGSLVWSGYGTWQKELTIERLKTFTESGLNDVDEASGGTVDPQRNVAYIVDDDQKMVFVFELKYNQESNKYSYSRDPNKEFSLWQGSRDNKIDIEDLEGAAYYNGKLYLVTGHSNKKIGERSKRKREQFLEVSLEKQNRGEVISVFSNLRKSIESIPEIKEAIDDQTGSPRREYMNIEGLAIDPQGKVYLGFRSPLLQNAFAIIVKTEIEQIFKEKNPKYEVIRLNLTYKGRFYGISSMELDQNNPSQILILANSSKRYELFPPVLWKWSFTEPNPGRPKNLDLVKAPIMQAPETFRAKPEVLLVPKSDQIGIFADAEGYGGQRIYTRQELGLLDNNSTF